MSFSVPDTGESRLKKSSTAAADAGIGGKMPGKLKNIGMTVLFAVPVFFVFVLTARIGGYDLLDLHPANVLPPIPVYLADFSLTFTTKLLIGSVTHLFVDKINYDTLFLICGIADIVAVAFLSLFFGALIVKGIRKKNFAVLFLCALCLANPLLSQEYFPAIGSYNTYWTVLFVLLIFLYDTKAFAILAPFVCVTGMMVHDGFLFAFAPAVLALLIYDFFNREGRAEKRSAAVSFVASAVSSGGLFLYSSFFQNNHLRMTAEQFYEYMVSKLDITLYDSWTLRNIYNGRLFPYTFFEIYFFDDLTTPGKTEKMNPFVFVSQLNQYKTQVLPEHFYLKYALIFIPFAAMFSALWILCIKKSEGQKKIPYIAFIGIQTVILPLIVISTDMYRWIPAIIISQAALVFAMLKNNDAAFTEALRTPLLKKWYVKIILILLAAALTAYMLWLGTALPMNDDVF